MAPAYEEAARKLTEAAPSVRLGKVDATVHGDLASRYDVRGYPTLKVFRQGKAYDYDGPRDAEGIVDYMVKQADPSWAPPVDRAIILTDETFNATVEQEPLMMVYFFAPWCGHCKRLNPDYEKAAQTLWDNTPRIKLAKVDATVETALARRFDVQGYPTLLVFRNGG